MSLFKLAVYGGIGYLVYQVFFNDAAAGMLGAHPQHAGQGQRGQASGQSGRSGGSPGRQQMSGGRGNQGAVQRTAEPSGMSTSHQVGRGVIS
jgi:hypothetical protein